MSFNKSAKHSRAQHKHNFYENKSFEISREISMDKNQ